MTTGKIEPQGWGEILPGLGEAIVQALIERNGLPTQVHLDDGSVIVALSSIWGRDFGEMWEHLYLNICAEIEDESVHFVQTSAIVQIIDPVSGRILYTRSFSN